MPQGYRIRQFPHLNYWRKFHYLEHCSHPPRPHKLTTDANIMIYQIEPFLVSMTSLPMFAFKVQDVNPFTRLGSFNLCLNLVWALLHVHPGSIFGSLSVFFTFLRLQTRFLSHMLQPSTSLPRRTEPMNLHLWYILQVHTIIIGDPALVIYFASETIIKYHVTQPELFGPHSAHLDLVGRRWNDQCRKLELETVRFGT